MSDLESLSDWEEWTKVSNNGGADSDNESVDSDQGEVSSAQHSRRSSISIASSQDDIPEVWEGLTSDAEEPLGAPIDGVHDEASRSHNGLATCK